MSLSSDERPAVWVGHVSLQASDLERSTDFWTKLGMRLIVKEDNVSVLELRGGTHLVLLAADEALAPGTHASFDVMVDDIDVAWKQYAQLGFDPSEIQPGSIHRSFTLVDPSGYRVVVNSTHVSDKPV